MEQQIAKLVSHVNLALIIMWICLQVANYAQTVNFLKFQVPQNVHCVSQEHTTEILEFLAVKNAQWGKLYLIGGALEHARHVEPDITIQYKEVVHHV